MTAGMNPSPSDSLFTWSRDQVDRLVAECGVPGAALTVRLGDDEASAASGVLNLHTGVPVTTGSTFQIGSVTKVFTAVLVMQLVDEGLLSLDDPVCRHVPDFVTADPDASRAITVRHLLAHTGGFEGDVFIDTGRGEDAVARLVSLLADVPQHSWPGELYSYSNAGYVVLGRILEVLRGAPYDVVLRERLLAPLDLQSSATCADEAILGLPAVGHLPRGETRGLEPTRRWSLPASNAPAGALLSVSSRDLTSFGGLFLRRGVAVERSTVLTQRAVDQMYAEQARCPDTGRAPLMRGLGWGMFDLPGGRVWGHDGATVGQYAFLRVVPGSGLVVSLLVNGGDPQAIGMSVIDAALEEFAGLSFEPALTPTATDIPDPERYVGAYRSGLVDVSVTAQDAATLWVEVAPRPVMGELGIPVDRYPVAACGEDLFVRCDGKGHAERHVFLGRDDIGRARFLHTGRAHARVDADE